MSHATRFNESCLAPESRLYEQLYGHVMPHVCMRLVTHMNESYHTYEWVMSHVCKRHVTHMNESCHTVPVVMRYGLDERLDLVYMNDARICPIVFREIAECRRCMTWFVHMCDITRLYVWHGSYVCVPWLLHTPDRCLRNCTVQEVCDMICRYVWHHSSICLTWLICMCAMTPSYTWSLFAKLLRERCVWHDLSICVTSLVYMFDMAHMYVCHDSFIHLIVVCKIAAWKVRVTSFVRMCDITLPYVWHDSYLRVTWHLPTPDRCLRNCCVTGACAHMCDMSHPYALYLCIPRLFPKCDTTHSYAQPSFARSLTASVSLIAVIFSPKWFRFLVFAHVLQCDRRVWSHGKFDFRLGTLASSNVFSRLWWQNLAPRKFLCVYGRSVWRAVSARDSGQEWVYGYLRQSDGGRWWWYASSCPLPEMVCVCSSMLQCAVVSCSVLQSAVVCYTWKTMMIWFFLPSTRHGVCCSVLQCVGVCCSVLQCVVCCSELQRSTIRTICFVWRSPNSDVPMLQCVAVCCSVLQCVAVCCSVLQCVAVRYSVL